MKTTGLSIAFSLLALTGLSAQASSAEDSDLQTYKCRSEPTEIIVSERQGKIAAFVLSSCSRIGCMTLALDDPDDGKLKISSSYLDGSTIDIATTARLSEDGILINSPIVVGQFGSDLTRLIGFANQFFENYADPVRRETLSCEKHD